MTENQKTKESVETAEKGKLTAEQQEVKDRLSKMPKEIREVLLKDFVTAPPDAKATEAKTKEAAPAAPKAPETAQGTPQGHDEKHEQGETKHGHAEETAHVHPASHPEETLPPPAPEPHPAALTGKAKSGTVATAFGLSALGAATVNGAPLLSTLGLDTSPWAVWGATKLQAAVQSVPYLGQWAASLGSLGPLTGTAAGAAVLMPATLGALYGIGKVSNAVARLGVGAYNVIFNKQHEHKNTGLSIPKNLWYGAKAVTSPIWAPIGFGLWGLRKGAEKLGLQGKPGLIQAALARTGHEISNACKWGSLGMIGYTAGGIIGFGALPSLGATIIIGTGAGYGLNLLYRAYNRIANKQPSTMGAAPAADHGHAPAADHGHGEADHGGGHGDEGGHGGGH